MNRESSVLILALLLAGTLTLASSIRPVEAEFSLLAVPEESAATCETMSTASSTEWNRTYGGTNEEWAMALVQTSDRGYALAGRTVSLGAGLTDFWLVKTDSFGNMQWSRTYGGTDFDDAYALVQTADDGYAIAGQTFSFGAGSTDAWLVRTDASGNVLWSKTYGGIGADYAQALVQTCDGGYALAGGTESFGAGYRDFWLVKVRLLGDVDGDFDVDLYDIVAICAAYGSKPPDPQYIPRVDINDDGIINIYDVVIACAHYGQKDP